MSVVTDISGRLERLNNTVQAARVVKQNLRATDWQRVQRSIQIMPLSFLLSALPWVNPSASR